MVRVQLQIETKISNRFSAANQAGEEPHTRRKQLNNIEEMLRQKVSYPHSYPHIFARIFSSNGNRNTLPLPACLFLSTFGRAVMINGSLKRTRDPPLGFDYAAAFLVFTVNLAASRAFVPLVAIVVSSNGKSLTYLVLHGGL